MAAKASDVDESYTQSDDYWNPNEYHHLASLILPGRFYFSNSSFLFHHSCENIDDVVENGVVVVVGVDVDECINHIC